MTIELRQRLRGASLCTAALLIMLSAVAVGEEPVTSIYDRKAKMTDDALAGANVPRQYRGATVVYSSAVTAFEGDLRELPKVAGWKPGDPIKEIPRRNNRQEDYVQPGPPANPVKWEIDPLLERQAAVTRGTAIRTFDPPELSFPGTPFNGVTPADPVGDVGANYYVQMTNTSGGSAFTFYDKNNGAVVAGPSTVDNLGSSQCASGLGDPVVLYDESAGRWLISEFSSFGNRLCVYVSQTGNPITGGWYAYNFPATNFPDYPKYGVWSDAYYVSSNENQPAAYALERNAMLNGQAASFQRLTAPSLAGFGFQALQPADIDGSSAPPAGSPGYFMRHRDDEVHNAGSNNPGQDFLEVWEFDVNFSNPALSSLTGPFNIAVTEFDSSLCGLFSFSCFDQPGGGSDLDPLREVIMWRLQYRNFGSHESLVGNLVTDVNGNDRGGVRWFELRRTGGNWSLHQEGTYSPDSDNRFMGSAAMDGDGNLAVAYSVSSTATFPSLRYAGRLATDPQGTLPQGEVSLIEGTGRSNSNRWGDYSSLNVDPVDECTFWYTMQYGAVGNVWNTQIGRFKFDSCGGPVGGTCGDGELQAGETCDDGNGAGGDGCSASCQVESGFVCTDPIPPSPGGNLVADPGFEGGTPNPSWNEASTNFGTPLCDPVSCSFGGGTGPLSGSWWSFFGGVSGVLESGSVDQDLVIPVGADTLTFWLEIPAVNTTGSVTASIDGNVLFTATQADAPTYAVYDQVSLDISAFADGGVHNLSFESTTNPGAGPLNFMVDDIEINGPATGGSPSVCTPISGDVLCDVESTQASYVTGEQIGLSTLRYANLSGSSLDTRLRLQLSYSTFFTANLIDFSFVLPDTADFDVAPLGLFNVSSSLPRGTWTFRCALEDPVTGAVQAEDLSNFEVQ